jgi:hypothetical protein
VVVVVVVVGLGQGLRGWGSGAAMRAAGGSVAALVGAKRGVDKVHDPVRPGRNGADMVLVGLWQNTLRCAGFLWADRWG